MILNGGWFMLDRLEMRNMIKNWIIVWLGRCLLVSFTAFLFLSGGDLQDGEDKMLLCELVCFQQHVKLDDVLYAANLLHTCSNTYTSHRSAHLHLFLHQVHQYPRTTPTNHFPSIPFPSTQA